MGESMQCGVLKDNQNSGVCKGKSHPVYLTLYYHLLVPDNQVFQRGKLTHKDSNLD